MSFILNHYYKRVVGKFDAVFTVSPNFVTKLKKYNYQTFLVPNYPSVNNLSFPEEAKMANI